MVPDSARTTDIAALAFEYGENVLLEELRTRHARLAHRGFEATRVIGSRLPQRVHDSVSSTVYGSIASGLRAGTVISRELAKRGFGRPVDTTARGRRLRAVINGVAGQQLRLASDPQTIVTAVRQDGQDVPASEWWLSQSFPAAQGHLVVFVHGLCESEDVWFGKAGLHEVVTKSPSATAVPIRYNSGLPVIENGTHLSMLLGQVVSAWPVAVRRITLVGNGMGGLVIRAALNRGRMLDTIWHRRVQDVVHLGIPQSGNVPEKVHQVTVSHLPGRKRTAQRRVSDAADQLRHSVISPHNWSDPEASARWGSDRLALAPLPWANHHYLVAQTSLDLASSIGVELHHERTAALLQTITLGRTAQPKQLGQ